MRRMLVALGTAVVIAFTACSSGSHQATPTTLPAATPAPTAATTAINPDVIPPVITVAYVNAVFAVLNHINGDVSRNLITDDRVTVQDKTYLRAIYDNPLYGQEVVIAQQSLGENLQNVRHPPGDVITRVRRLLSASHSCVFVETQSNFSSVLIDPGPPAASEYFELAPKQPGIDPQHLNPTPWALRFNASYVTPTTITDQCTA
jgi:hypothetical protein